MKKLLLAAFSFWMFSANAQSQKIIPCYSHEHNEELMQNDPIYRHNQQVLEQQIQQYIAAHPNGESERNNRIIPVVFHILHQYGSENISKAQILDQIRILNEDYQRTNPDTVNTPAPFKPLAAGMNVEFRLAQKDPQGNCTDGIVRVYTPLTNAVNPRDNLKAVSYWNSANYLNIWVVKEIYNQSGQQGIILGYAQFPGGSAATDGVVLRSDVVGSIGTSSFANVGRTATHEVGHWLNLRHIWGDFTCGNDQVSDTPVHEAANAGCPTFPHNVNSQCNPGPNGEMYTNYMDYTDGICQNMFTAGQVARMNAVLNTTRANLWSASNLATTGLDGNGPTDCAPKADFTPFNFRTVCEGGSISFTDRSFNGTPTQWQWSFPGGTPSTDTVPNPTVTYNTAGTYDVTLTVSNASGSNSKTTTNRVIVFPAGNGVYQPLYTMGFEDANQFTNDITILNEDGDARQWNRVTNVGYNSSSCLRLDNAATPAAGFKDAILTPSFNLQGVTNVRISFNYSHIQKNSANSDQLQVLVSNNCGQTWIPRWTGSGSNLSYTSSTQNTSFTPSNASQWKSQTVNIAAAYAKANTRFKLEFTSGGGNNIFLDNINIDGVVGVNSIEQFDESSLLVFPNPSNGNTQVIFTSPAALKGDVKIFDLVGKEIFSLSSVSFNEGENRIELAPSFFPSSGVYFITLKTELGALNKKVIIE